MDRELDSGSSGCGFESHLILDGNGVKTMPGSISVYPFLVNLMKKKKNTGNHMGHTKKKKKKNLFSVMFSGSLPFLEPLLSDVYLTCGSAD